MTAHPTRPAARPGHTQPALEEPDVTDRPYTDDDLIAEAARQHATLAEDPDFMGVGEQMEDAWVPSAETTEDGSARTWAELLDPEQDGTNAYDEAQRRIHDLINGAADTSAWAVKLGADGLEPAEHTLQLGVQDGDDGEDKPQIRLHFAFARDLPDEDRDRFVMELGKVVLRNL